MKKNKVFYSLLASFFLAFFRTPVFSSWFLYPDEVSNDFRLNRNYKNDGNAVAYFGTGNNRRNFTTIEGALRAAEKDTSSNVVYVVPGTNPTIYSSCTIADGDTLCIPFEGENTTGDAKDVGSSFGDNSNCKSRVTLLGKLTISSKATLLIGGKTGSYSYPYEGGTYGDCAERNLDGNGSIECSGKIECYGFIHDYKEGKRDEKEVAITLHNGASVIEPLVRYNWPGGTEASNRKGEDIFPCNIFDLPNIRAPMKFEYGSTLQGSGKVYTSGIIGIGAGYYGATANIVTKDDNEGFLQLKSGTQSRTKTEGSVIIDPDDFDSNKGTYNPKTTSWNHKNHRTRFITEGDLSFDGVKVTVGISLDTRDGYLPISGIFDILVDNGYCDIKYAAKRLPGSKLTIGTKGQIEFKGNFVAYQSLTDRDGATLGDYSGFTGPASITNKGKRIIDKGFDGVIVSDTTTGQVVTESSYSGVSDCKDYDSNKAYSSFEFKGGANRQMAIEEYELDGTSGYVLRGNSNALSNKVYYSRSTIQGGYGWALLDQKSYPIVVDFNGNDAAIDPNGQKYIDNYGEGTAIQNLQSLDSSKTFNGFYYDKACTVPVNKNREGLFNVEPSKLSNYLQGNKLTIYANWEETQVSFKRIVRSYNGGDKTTDVVKSVHSGYACDITKLEFYVPDSRKIDKVDKTRKTEYTFKEWVVYDQADPNTILNTTFEPVDGHTYIRESRFTENKFLWMKVTNSSWESGFVKKETWYVINGFEISGNDVSQEGSLFVPGSVLNNTKTQEGWIRIASDVNRTVYIESRTSGGRNKVDIKNNGITIKTAKGTYSGLGTVNQRYTMTDFDSSLGPLTLECGTY